jgi:hypothetical protein
VCTSPQIFLYIGDIINSQENFCKENSKVVLREFSSHGSGLAVIFQLIDIFASVQITKYLSSGSGKKKLQHIAVQAECELEAP